jgi:tetratricopeptide (TPR) repeat protein
MHKQTLLFFAAIAVSSTSAQVPAKSPAATPNVAEHAGTLAESGRCADALPLLAKTATHLTDKELQKRIGLDGVRCATTLQRQEPLQEFLSMLSRQFPHDPEVLYVLTHAYSDLSARSARELAITAPTSIPALEMDADTNEQQGKWDAAEKDYRKILEENPRYPSIHFRLARLLLSKPNPAPDFAEQAKKELQQELEIDPANAGAEYVLGELARQATDLPAAVEHFSKATKFDNTFAATWAWACLCWRKRTTQKPSLPWRPR